MLVAGLTAVIQSVTECKARRGRLRPVDRSGAETDSDGAAPDGSVAFSYRSLHRAVIGASTSGGHQDSSLLVAPHRRCGIRLDI
jgi:hypothetical protein